MESQPLAPNDVAGRRQLAMRIHQRKNEIYAALVHGGAIKLRPGVRELMDDCAQAGVQMAIVTTTSRGNVAALLESNLGKDWQRRFATVVAAEDAPRKKPDPEAYRLVLERLAIDAGSAVAIEDSSAGLRSASAVGVRVVIARSRYFADDPVPGALAVGPSLGSSAGWSPPARRSGGRMDLAQIVSYLESAKSVQR